MRKQLTDAERIDAEPKQPRVPQLRVGVHVWFVDTTSRWYLLEVVEKVGRRTVTYKPVTGWDAERQVEWPYGALLEFNTSSALAKRLRPLSARRP